MEAAEIEIEIQSGEVVDIVFYVDGQPTIVKGTIQSFHPIVITSSSPAASRFGSQRRALVLIWTSAGLRKVETRVKDCYFKSGLWVLNLESLVADYAESRRHSRISIQIPILVKTISDLDSKKTPIEYLGITSNLSLGGALIEAFSPIDERTVVEAKARLTDFDSIRMLGVIVRSTEPGNRFGIEFIDFIGGARYHLTSFLNRVI